MQQHPHHPQRHPSRQDRKNLQVRRAVMILVALTVTAAAIGYAYYATRRDTRPINEANFCPTDAKGPGSVTAVLIDRTDPFSPTQETALRDRLDDIKEHTSRYDLIEIYTVEPTVTSLLRPEFSMCNPGRGDDINAWTGNPQMVEERWKMMFGEPLKHLFDSVLVGETARTSPIMESIQSIAVTKLASQDLVSKKIPRRLIIISDLLQYVKGYSQYHQPLKSFDDFKSSTYYQGVRSDLSGVSIEIWYVRRKSTLPLQNEAHMDFWRQYLSDQGGIIDKVWEVPGI